MTINKKVNKRSVATINIRCTVDVYNAWAQLTRSDAFTSTADFGKQTRPPAGTILMALIENYLETHEPAKVQSLPAQDYVRGREYMNRKKTQDEINAELSEIFS